MNNSTELKAALDELKGLKPDDIAAMLTRRKITGRPATTGNCPLSKLMHNVHGGTFIVGQKFIIRRQGKDVERVATPTNVASFIRQFDMSKYASLIAPPPRCLVKAIKSIKDKLRPKRSGGHRATPRTPAVRYAKVAGRLSPA